MEGLPIAYLVAAAGSRHSDDPALENSDRRRQDLDSATAANGVAFNIGRAAGPAAETIEQVRSDRRVAALERRQPNCIDTLRHPHFIAKRVAGRTPAAAWRLRAGGGLARHGAIAYLDAWGLGLNVLFSLAGGADVADGRLSALSDVGVRALRTIALAA
jgi:hypothetical protein